MAGGNKKVTHTVTFLLPLGIKELALFYSLYFYGSQFIDLIFLEKKLNETAWFEWTRFGLELAITSSHSFAGCCKPAFATCCNV